MQRKNGKCTYSKRLPYLTCNNGNPCKDLCAEAFEGDIGKYEILIESTERMIENAKMYKRDDLVNENQELVNRSSWTKMKNKDYVYSNKLKWGE